MSHANVPSGGEIIDSNVEVELVVVERKGTVGAVIMSVKVRNTTGQVVTSIGNMATQRSFGDVTPRRGGQGDGVIRVT